VYNSIVERNCTKYGRLVACFDSTLMASSHPVITSYFRASSSASWLSTAFLLTSTAFQQMFGRISDTFGRRAPFLLSIAVFAVGTAWCAASQSISSFILARVVCGFDAGGAMAMGAIINSDLVPIQIRGSYQSILNLAFGIGSSLGAAMGGFLADALGWRWEFAIQSEYNAVQSASFVITNSTTRSVPAILMALIVVWFATPDDLGPQLAKNKKVDFLQTVKGFDMIGSLSLAISVTFFGWRTESWRQCSSLESSCHFRCSGGVHPFWRGLYRGGTACNKASYAS
jgi:MFS family permease